MHDVAWLRLSMVRQWSSERLTVLLSPLVEDVVAIFLGGEHWDMAKDRVGGRAGW